MMENNKPKTREEILTDIFTMISERITGKKPKNINIEEGMSIDEEGELEENMAINMDLGDGESIEGKIIMIDSPEKFMRIIERENNKAAIAKDKMDEWIDNQYERMGLIDDFKKQFPNVDEFDDIVLEWVENVEADDFIWLCNELKELELILDDDNLMNYRICCSKIGEITKEYKSTQKGGCCKVFDHIITNPKTGNKFSIGCNHDHGNEG